MAKPATPAVSQPGDWTTTLDLHVTVTFPTEGARRVHTPHLAELRNRVEQLVETYLTSITPTPYALDSIEATAIYGYGFDVG